MKRQKLGQIIFATILVFAPLALFAAVVQYDNPLGCGLTSLPQFIKAVLTIVVKVGIPVATLFIIWSGFLFLTAQGDETQLTKAKHSFVWACIGTAVLLGSWLLATAINGTIQSIGGGTAGSAGTTVDGGCGEALPPNIAGAFFWPNPVSFAQSELLAYEKESDTNTDALSQCVDFYEALSLNSKTTESTSANKPMEETWKANSTACSYDEGITSIQSKLNSLPEQSILWASYKNGFSEFIKGGEGTNDSVPTPTAIMNSLVEQPYVSAVYVMHTHPFAASKTKYSPPSLMDIMIAYRQSSTYDKQKFFNKVIDTGIVWTYTIDSNAPIGAALDTIRNETTTFIKSSPDIEKSWTAEYGATQVQNKNDLSRWSNATCHALIKAGNGDFGNAGKESGNKLAAALADSELFKYKTHTEMAINDYPSNGGKVITTASNLGVILTTELHPYAWCTNPPISPKPFSLDQELDEMTYRLSGIWDEMINGERAVLVAEKVLTVIPPILPGGQIAEAIGWGSKVKYLRPVEEVASKYELAKSSFGISALKTTAGNAAALRSYLKTSGEVIASVWDDGAVHLIDGNTRVYAALKYGLTAEEIPARIFIKGSAPVAGTLADAIRLSGTLPK
jgi:hypothetical protein